MEKLLPDLVLSQKVVRLKGRAWLPGKSLPLQIQMVGPRLNTWFEDVPSNAWRPGNGGFDLVVLSFKENADKIILDALKKAFSN